MLVWDRACAIRNLNTASCDAKLSPPLTLASCPATPHTANWALARQLDWPSSGLPLATVSSPFAQWAGKATPIPVFGSFHLQALWAPGLHSTAGSGAGFEDSPQQGPQTQCQPSKGSFSFVARAKVRHREELPGPALV